MRWEPVEVAAPGSGELLLKQSAIGLNFIDVYERTGLYPNKLPTGLGREAAGVVEEIGPDVKGFEIGDRVAYVLGVAGAFGAAAVFGAATCALRLAAAAATFSRGGNAAFGASALAPSTCR